MTEPHLACPPPPLPPPPTHRLSGLLADVACKINLIEFNPHDDSTFLPSLRPDVLAFKSALVQVRGG